MPDNIATGAARNYTQRTLGGPTSERETNPTVGVTITPIANQNADRVGLVIVNNGLFDVYIGFNSAISNTNGILISAGGGNVSFKIQDDFTLLTRMMYAIAIGGSSLVYVLEVVRVSLTDNGA